MQSPNLTTQQNLQLTDDQRHFLQKERRNLILPLIIFVAFFSFCLFIIIASLQQSFFVGALFFSVFTFVFVIGITLCIHALWTLSYDLREGIVEKVEGTVQLSVNTEKGKSGATYYTYVVELGRHYFTVPQLVYLQLKDGNYYRLFYARRSKTFLYTEFDTPQGVQVIDRSAKIPSQNLPPKLYEPVNIVDETEVKLKRDMQHGYRGVLYHRFRRDSITALWIFGLLSLPVMCTGVFLAFSPDQPSSNWLILAIYAIPSGLILLALLYDYIQLFRDIRSGTLKTFDGRVSMSEGFGRHHLNVVDIQYGGKKHFSVSREIFEELVDRQVYRVFYTPHSEIFVYAEPL